MKSLIFCPLNFFVMSRLRNLYFRGVDPEVYRMFLDLKVELGFKHHMDVLSLVVRLAYELHRQGKLLDVCRSLGLIRR